MQIINKAKDMAVFAGGITINIICDHSICTMNKIEQNSVTDNDRDSAIGAVMKDLSKIKQNLLKNESDVSPLQTLV